MDLFIHATDISPRAVQMVQENSLYDPERINAFQCDVTKDDCFHEHIKSESVDIASLIFVLSAVRPIEFGKVLKNVHRVLKRNGLLIFRDYSVNDMAMFRFKKGSKIDDRHYLRHDGTTSYFFEQGEMRNLAEEAGFSIDANEIVERRTINKKEEVDVQRLFLQGKYRKK